MDWLEVIGVIVGVWIVVSVLVTAFACWIITLLKQEHFVQKG